MKISLIIPCYNEEEALPYIYEELVKVSATLSDYEIEYLFVNDGSKDHTLDKLKELAAHDERVKYFSFAECSRWSVLRVLLFIMRGMSVLQERAIIL